MIKKISAKIRDFWKSYDKAASYNLTEALEYEVSEMEHIFGLLALGSFVGMPSPPMQISLELMPYLEQELILMFHKTDTASSPLSDLASVLDVG